MRESSTAAINTHVYQDEGTRWHVPILGSGPVAHIHGGRAPGLTLEEEV